MQLIKATYFDRYDIITKVSWMNDVRINEHMYFALPARLDKTEDWFDNNRDNDKRVDFVFKQSEIRMAMGGYTNIDQSSRHAEFYIMVNPEMLGMGIGSKVSLWMYNYAFIKLKLNKIYLYTDDTNAPSSKIYEKAGFQMEGLLRQHKLKEGNLRDRRIYGLLRREWEEKNWKTININYDF